MRTQEDEVTKKRVHNMSYRISVDATIPTRERRNYHVMTLETPLTSEKKRLLLRQKKAIEIIGMDDVHDTILHQPVVMDDGVSQFVT